MNLSLICIHVINLFTCYLMKLDSLMKWNNFKRPATLGQLQAGRSPNAFAQAFSVHEETIERLPDLITPMISNTEIKVESRFGERIVKKPQSSVFNQIHPMDEAASRCGDLNACGE